MIGLVTMTKITVAAIMITIFVNKKYEVPLLYLYICWWLVHIGVLYS